MTERPIFGIVDSMRRSAEVLAAGRCPLMDTEQHTHSMRTARFTV